MMSRHVPAWVFLLVLWAALTNCAPTALGKGRVDGAIPEIKKDCTICHLVRETQVTPQLKNPLSELCFQCHPDRKAPAEHVVDVTPSMKVKGLPLTEGKMTCITCHDPHKNPYGKMLRVHPRDLCQKCHPY